MKIKNDSYGFTVVELLVVLGILAFIAAALLPSVAPMMKKAKESRAKADIVRLEVALQAYATKDINGYYPKVNTNAEMQTLLRSRVEEMIEWDVDASGQFVDPWGNDYEYRGINPSNNASFVDIWSRGPDGANNSGGGDDINNWSR